MSYLLGGTAANGVDYAALPASAIIPAGSPSVDVLVAPIDDRAGRAVGVSHGDAPDQRGVHRRFTARPPACRSSATMSRPI